MVRNTIQKMRDAGLSDTIISSTLADLGLSTGQVQGFLSGNTGARMVAATASQNSYSTSPRPTTGSSMNANTLDHEEIASRTSDKIVSRLDERNALDDEEADLKDNITHLAMEQHGAQLQETHQAVMELHDKFDSTSLDTLSNRVSSMNTRMEQLSKDVIEIKSMSLALQSLLQKILETNQEFLFEMKSKK